MSRYEVSSYGFIGGTSGITDPTISKFFVKSLPDIGVLGQVVFMGSEERLYIHDGTDWISAFPLENTLLKTPRDAFLAQNVSAGNFINFDTIEETNTLIINAETRIYNVEGIPSPQLYTHGDLLYNTLTDIHYMNVGGSWTRIRPEWTNDNASLINLSGFNKDLEYKDLVNVPLWTLNGTLTKAQNEVSVEGFGGTLDVSRLANSTFIEGVTAGGSTIEGFLTLTQGNNITLTPNVGTKEIQIGTRSPVLASSTPSIAGYSGGDVFYNTTTEESFILQGNTWTRVRPSWISDSQSSVGLAGFAKTLQYKDVLNIPTWTHDGLGTTYAQNAIDVSNFNTSTLTVPYNRVTATHSWLNDGSNNALPQSSVLLSNFGGSLDHTRIANVPGFIDQIRVNGVTLTPGSLFNINSSSNVLLTTNTNTLTIDGRSKIKLVTSLPTSDRQNGDFVVDSTSKTMHYWDGVSWVTALVSKYEQLQNVPTWTHDGAGTTYAQHEIDASLFGTDSLTIPFSNVVTKPPWISSPPTWLVNGGIAYSQNNIDVALFGGNLPFTSLTSVPNFVKDVLIQGVGTFAAGPTLTIEAGVNASVTNPASSTLRIDAVPNVNVANTLPTMGKTNDVVIQPSTQTLYYWDDIQSQWVTALESVVNYRSLQDIPLWTTNGENTLTLAQNEIDITGFDTTLLEINWGKVTNKPNLITGLTVDGDPGGSPYTFVGGSLNFVSGTNMSISFTGQDVILDNRSKISVVSLPPVTNQETDDVIVDTSTNSLQYWNGAAWTQAIVVHYKDISSVPNWTHDGLGTTYAQNEINVTGFDTSSLTLPQNRITGAPSWIVDGSGNALTQNAVAISGFGGNLPYNRLSATPDVIETIQVDSVTANSGSSLFNINSGTRISIAIDSPDTIRIHADTQVHTAVGLPGSGTSEHLYIDRDNGTLYHYDVTTNDNVPKFRIIGIAPDWLHNAGTPLLQNSIDVSGFDTSTLTIPYANVTSKPTWVDITQSNVSLANFGGTLPYARLSSAPSNTIETVIVGGQTLSSSSLTINPGANMILNASQPGTIEIVGRSKIDVVSSNPTVDQELNDIVINTADNSLYYWNGSTWTSTLVGNYRDLQDVPAWTHDGVVTYIQNQINVGGFGGTLPFSQLSSVPTWIQDDQSTINLSGFNDDLTSNNVERLASDPIIDVNTVGGSIFYTTTTETSTFVFGDGTDAQFGRIRTDVNNLEFLSFTSTQRTMKYEFQETSAYIPSLSLEFNPVSGKDFDGYAIVLWNKQKHVDQDASNPIQYILDASDNVIAKIIAKLPKEHASNPVHMCPIEGTLGYFSENRDGVTVSRNSKLLDIQRYDETGFDAYWLYACTYKGDTFYIPPSGGPTTGMLACDYTSLEALSKLSPQQVFVSEGIRDVDLEVASYGDTSIQITSRLKESTHNKTYNASYKVMTYDWSRPIYDMNAGFTDISTETMVVTPHERIDTNVVRPTQNPFVVLHVNDVPIHNLDLAIPARTASSCPMARRAFSDVFSRYYNEEQRKVGSRMTGAGIVSLQWTRSVSNHPGVFVYMYWHPETPYKKTPHYSYSYISNSAAARLAGHEFYDSSWQSNANILSVYTTYSKMEENAIYDGYYNEDFGFGQRNLTTNTFDSDRIWSTFEGAIQGGWLFAQFKATFLFIKYGNSHHDDTYADALSGTTSQSLWVWYDTYIASNYPTQVASFFQYLTRKTTDGRDVVNRFAWHEDYFKTTSYGGLNGTQLGEMQGNL